MEEVLDILAIRTAFENLWPEVTARGFLTHGRSNGEIEPSSLWLTQSHSLTQAVLV